MFYDKHSFLQLYLINKALNKHTSISSRKLQKVFTSVFFSLIFFGVKWLKKNDEFLSLKKWKLTEWEKDIRQNFHFTTAYSPHRRLCL